MKTKTKKWLGLFTATAMALTLGCALVACGDNADKITVTWYDGRTELKTEKLEKGSKATEWTPEKDGYEFRGWYAEASLATPFNFETKLDEDTDIYSQWLKLEYVEDTNTYYAIGTGSGTMSASGWAHNPDASAGLNFEKDTTVTNANVYTIELSMYAGDRFQICFGSWDGQMGIGYVTGAEYADFEVGQNPYMPTLEGTAADQDYAVVKNAAGDIVFHGGNEYDNAYTNWNIVCYEGQDGVYKFTLHTYPGQESNNYIDWELIEPIEALEKTHEMYIVGTMTDWTDGEKIPMIESEDKTYWTGFVTIGQGDKFKVHNTIGNGWYDNNGGNDMAPAVGDYAVKYTVATNIVEYEKLSYYIVGTFLDGENAVNFSVKKGVTPELNNIMGNYIVEFTAVDVTANSNYSWIATQGKDGVFAFKVVYGSEIAIKDWYSDVIGVDEDGKDITDNFYVNAGLHVLTLVFDEGKAEIHVEEAEALETPNTTEYYLVGSLTGWDVTDNTYAFTRVPTYTSMDVFRLEVELRAGTEFKIVHDSSWDGEINGNSLMPGGEALTNEGNIKVAAGHDGVYELLLVFVDVEGSTRAMLYYNLLEAITEELPPDMYLVGTYYGDDDNWDDDYSAEWCIKLTRGDDGVWTCTITVTEDMYPSWSAAQNGGTAAAAFKVKNHSNGSDYGVDGGTQNIFLTAGTYTISWDEATNNVTVTPVEAD